MACRTRLGSFGLRLSKRHCTRFINRTGTAAGAAAIRMGPSWIHDLSFRSDDAYRQAGTMVVGYTWINVQKKREIRKGIGVAQRTVYKIDLIIAFGEIKGYLILFDGHSDPYPDRTVWNGSVPVTRRFPVVDAIRDSLDLIASGNLISPYDFAGTRPQGFQAVSVNQFTDIFFHSSYGAIDQHVIGLDSVRCPNIVEDNFIYLLVYLAVFHDLHRRNIQSLS